MHMAIRGLAASCKRGWPATRQPCFYSQLHSQHFSFFLFSLLFHCTLLKYGTSWLTHWGQLWTKGGTQETSTVLKYFSTEVPGYWALTHPVTLQTGVWVLPNTVRNRDSHVSQSRWSLPVTHCCALVLDSFVRLFVRSFRSPLLRFEARSPTHPPTHSLSHHCEVVELVVVVVVVVGRGAVGRWSLVVGRRSFVVCGWVYYVVAKCCRMQTLCGC